METIKTTLKYIKANFIQFTVSYFLIVLALTIIHELLHNH